MYQKNGMQEVWESLKYDITDKFLTYEGTYSNTERVELGICKRDIGLKFNIIPDNTAAETVKEEEHKKEALTSDAKELESIKSIHVARTMTMSFLSDDLLQHWKEFAAKMISEENIDVFLINL